MDEIATTDLSREQARALTDRIKAGVAELLPIIREAFERRADAALGYESWQAYCDTELRGLRLPVGDRREAVAGLREAGMSTRAIGAALGIGQTQVMRDLGRLNTNGSVDQPETVTSLDGRERPASRPEPPADPLPAQIAEQIQQRIDEKSAQHAGTCEACGGDLPKEQAGYRRCEDCDSEGEHLTAGFPQNTEGPCAMCGPAEPTDAEPAEPTIGELPPVACEKCGNQIEAAEAAQGYRRCDTCDPDGDHTAAELADGGYGECRACKEAEPQWSEEEEQLRARLEAGETIVVSLRARHANLVQWAEKRGLFVRIDRRSDWGNPFELPGDGDRDTVIRHYAEHYLPYKPSLLARIKRGDLAGKALGCWCAPEPCHGDVLKQATKQ